MWTGVWSVMGYMLCFTYSAAQIQSLVHPIKMVAACRTGSSAQDLEEPLNPCSGPKLGGGRGGVKEN